MRKSRKSALSSKKQNHIRHLALKQVAAIQTANQKNGQVVAASRWNRQQDQVAYRWDTFKGIDWDAICQHGLGGIAA